MVKGEIERGRGEMKDDYFVLKGGWSLLHGGRLKRMAF